MHNRSKSDVLLTELIIVVLFFSLVAVTVVQMFVAAHNKSDRSNLTERALVAAQDCAERLYGGRDAESVLLQAGFVQTDEGLYTLVREGSALTVEAKVQPEVPTGAGRMLGATVSVYRAKAKPGEAAEPLVVLPVQNYIPLEEVQP